MTSPPGIQLLTGPGPWNLDKLNQFWPGSPTSPLFPNNPEGRAAALAAGFAVGPYDPSKPSKCYQAIPAWPDGLSCGYYDQNGVRQSIALSGAEAPLNIWGPAEYPKYVPAPTPATRSGVPMPPAILSSQMDADGLLAAWKAAFPALTIAASEVVFSDDLMNGETRKSFALNVNGPGILNLSGEQFYVGEQIALSMANGVGAPGHWTWDNTTQTAVWISDIPPLPNTPTPEGPIPQWQIDSNIEQFVSGGMMGQLMFGPKVVVSLQSPSTMGGSGLSVEQDARLMRIEAKLDRIIIADRIP